MFSRFKKSYRTYAHNDDGLALIEGAMILPIAIIMFIGIFEVGQMLILNQKLYAASHMVGDLLARKPILDDDDIDEAFNAARLIIEPFDSSDLLVQIVGVSFDDEENAEQVWQVTMPTGAADANLFTQANNLGEENAGAIIVSATYEYQTMFPDLRLPFLSEPASFGNIEMREFSVLRGRINPCISYNDNECP